MSADQLLTSTDVAAMLRCSARTVLRMAEDGRLPVVQKFPGQRGANLFHRKDIERYLRDRDREPNGNAA